MTDRPKPPRPEQRSRVREVVARARRLAWGLRHPRGTDADYYVALQQRVLQRGDRLGALGPEFLEPERQRQLADDTIASLRERGMTPDSVVVDYGCGSLRLGLPLMDVLEPRGYTGLDVTRAFMDEAIARMLPEWVAERAPTLEIATPAALRRARERNPNFVVSINAVQHVDPRWLGPAFFEPLRVLMAPHTRTYVTLRLHEVGWLVREATWVHQEAQVDAALSNLGLQWKTVREYDNPKPRSTARVQEIQIWHRSCGAH